jgi:hypothetical protein
MADPTPKPAPAPRVDAPTEAPAQYRVTAPLVITKKPDGSDLYVYEGGLLPVTATDAEVARLLEGGFVDKVGAFAVADPAAESN